MVKLLDSFARTRTFVNNTGCVLFESSTAGTDFYIFERRTRCGIICVGGGCGGFCAKLGVVINEGTPSQQVFSGLTAMSGGSGGYSYSEHIFEKDDIAIIFVGSGGTKFSSTNIYAVSQSNPRIDIGVTDGSASRVIVGSSLLCFANPGTGGSVYLSNPSDANTLTFSPSSGGSGSVSFGNNGSVVAQGSNVSIAGGGSVYGGHGIGGAAGFSGDNQSGSPWANNGTSGYVKIFVLAEDVI